MRPAGVAMVVSCSMASMHAVEETVDRGRSSRALSLKTPIAIHKCDLAPSAAAANSSIEIHFDR